MAKLKSLFDTFLSNIEPDNKAVKYAVEAHTKVRDCLEEDENFKEFHKASFLYGSYKRHTAVGTIKDVDIVVLTRFDPQDKEHTPNKVLRKLKAALARCYSNADFLEYQRRSIRVDEPLPDNEEVEMTLDVIPAVATDGDDQPLLVPDREQKEWIKTHPKGHLQYSTRLNDEKHGNGKYVPLVKMMKWWWKYQAETRQPDVERPKPKGFWVECLTGENFDASHTDWADHFITVLANIAAKYKGAKTVPALQDPGLRGEVVKTNMTVKEFDLFMAAVTECLEQAKTARDEPDNLKSSELWREIFGEKFPLYEEEELVETKSISYSLALGDASHAERLRWPEQYQKRYKVRLDAFVYFKTQRLRGLNSNGRRLASGYRLKFVAKPNVPYPYEVYWQVVNTGPHARAENGLRGQFCTSKWVDGSPSSSALINWEETQYTGKHWIECFIIKDGACVARSGRFYINILNPNHF